MDINLEFSNCLQRIVQGSDYKQAWDDLLNLIPESTLELSKPSSKYTRSLNYEEHLRTILKQEPIKNVHQMPQLLVWFSNFLVPSNANNPISDDIAIFLQKSVEFFKENPCLAEIIKVIKNEKYLPRKEDHAQLCKAIVEVLSWMPVPEKSNEIQKYTQDLLLIKDFLKTIKCYGVHDNVALLCYKELCAIFLNSERTGDPSSALVIVLEVLDDNIWKDYMQYIIPIIRDQIPDQKIIQMLSLFCKWMLQPPNTNMKYLSLWITLFMRKLEESIKDTLIPRKVAECTLPEIMHQCLKRNEFYCPEGAENVTVFLLQKIQLLTVFHTVLKQLNEFLRSNSQIFKYNKDVCRIKYVLQIASRLLIRFKKHQENKCPLCSETDELISDMARSFNNYGNTMEICQPSTSRGYGKLDTSKVGLQNLGNTCYMNSVLQALAMTRKFCHEVLLYKSTNELNDQKVLKNLQQLFALLKYSERKCLAPTEILLASRPAYFTPGQQQDSSEFLCHLLDVMFEQEKSALMQSSNRDQTNNVQSKLEDKEMTVVEEFSGTSHSPSNDDGASPNMTRWTTEENLCEGASLQRKTHSLADFTQGEDLAPTQNALSDSHSDSTDSGIQSVGGEDSTSSTSTRSSSSILSSSSYLVHRVFGGELKVIYQCNQCGTESHNIDQFRDLQLCFLDDLKDKITVQDLINVNYFSPEKLTDDNKYRCDKCSRLCDAQRIIKIVQAPEHLILTLKYFRYDSESRLRTKLRCKVHYDEKIGLPVLDKANETYQLYAAVVHSGYSMDYGHYITYACDAEKCWYKFNDNYVMQTTFEHFKRLEPPDTPYILFYKRCTNDDQQNAPELTSLSKHLQEYIEIDRRKFEEERRIARLSMNGSAITKFNPRNQWDRHDDDDGQGRNCGDPVNIPNQQYLC